MKNIFSIGSQTLIVQGTLISLFGIAFLFSVLMGFFNQSGFLSTMIKEPMVYVTMFEAYGLATVCGIIIIALSKITLSPFRHLLAALVDVQFIITSILFWNLYEINNMEIIGYSSLLFHFVFGLIQLLLFTKSKNNLNTGIL